MRSNAFANLENKFESLSAEELISSAFDSMYEFYAFLDGLDDDIKFCIILSGARLGVSGDGIINEQEKIIVDRLFGEIWQGPIERIYEELERELGDGDYGVVKKLTDGGSCVALPYLNFILSFAYIDGVFEDEVAEKLDKLYGMILLSEFLQSGSEDFPSQTLTLTGINAKIVEWFRSHDELRTARDVCSHFKNTPAAEVKRALDYLCDKGVFYNIDTVAGKMYGLL